jgi:hypothetical protein
MKDIEAYIRRYLSLGFSIIPIKNKEKIPLVEWKRYQIRPPNRREISEWLRVYWSTGANVGVVCGAVSGNLVVLDFDTDAAWNGFLATWKAHRTEEICASTLVVKTSRGHQVYMRVSELMKKQKAAAGFDLQAEGSYVVAPPSRHPSGAIYQFLGKAERRVLKIGSLVELGIEIDSDLGIDRESPTRNQERHAHRANNGLDTDFLEGVSKGGRDDACFRYACRCRNKGMEYETTLVLCEMGADMCIPPFPYHEVEKCVKSAYRYQ